MARARKRFVVTGAAGFIGSHLVQRLVEEGFEVVGVDNLVTGRLENLSGLLDRIDFVQDDAGKPGVLKKILRRGDFVLHQAAIPSVQRSVDDPLSTHYSCVEVTLKLLLAAREAGVRRVVVAASSSAYGDSEILPKREDMAARPLSPYAAAKLAQEQYARAFSVSYGLDTASLRYFNVFGPRQDPTSQYAAVIPKFITLMLRGERPTIYGDGTQSRDFTYVENVVRANLLAARCGGALKGEVLNIACGLRIDLNDLVAQLNAILGTSIDPLHGPPAPGDVKHSLADISLAKKRIGYEPSVDFEMGLRLTVDWFREQG
ncbi:MAG: SDR family oxidoreductase [Planctomycetota bacterium]